MAGEAGTATTTVAAITMTETVAATTMIEAVTRTGTVAETVMGIGIRTETREGTKIWTGRGAGGMKMRKRTGVLEEGGGRLLLRIPAMSQSCTRFTEGG
jgi:hypothetical protein